jgi:hypothetical protein
VIGPGLIQWDASLLKNFNFTERTYLQFRFESFNFTNTPAFGNPNTSVGSVNVGQITTAGDPRRIQFALKYVF